MLRIFLLIIFASISINCSCQGFGANKNQVQIDSTKKDHPRFDRFIDFMEPDESSQNYLFNYSYEYLYLLKFNSFRSGGFHVNFGLNVARFFSRKIIIGICLDEKFLYGFTHQNLSSAFVNDFNSNFIGTYSNSTDSARAYTIRDGIYGTKLINGCFLNSAGIMISIFPQKYGGFALQIKRGSRGFPVFGTLDNMYLQNGSQDQIMLTFKRTYVAELSFKPLAFFRNCYLQSENKYKFLDFIVVSLYYERLNFKKAEFDTMKFTNMVNDPFFTKNGIDNRFGFNIGFAIY
jgi:hypothetical protein